MLKRSLREELPDSMVCVTSAPYLYVATGWAFSDLAPKLIAVTFGTAVINVQVHVALFGNGKKICFSSVWNSVPSDGLLLLLPLHEVVKSAGCGVGRSS